MNAPPPYAQENLILLQNHYSDIAKSLLEYLQTQRQRGEIPSFQTINTPSKQPSLIHRSGAQTIFLHDRNQPAVKAIEQIKTLLENPPGLVVVYSCGLGYVPCALTPCLSQCRIIVIEPEYDLLFLALQTNDWRALLPSPNLMLLTGSHAYEEGKQMVEQYGSLLDSGFRVVAGRNLFEKEQALLESLQSCCESSRKRFFSLRETRSELDPACVSIAVSETHRDLLNTFGAEIGGLGYDARPFLRRKVETRFTGTFSSSQETIGMPLPGTVFTLSPFLFTPREWEEMGNRNIRRIVWFFDDPFRFELDDSYVNQMDAVYCFDPFLSERMQNRFSLPVRYMPAATSFSYGVMGSPPAGLPKSSPVTFIGSTGLQRFDGRFAQWIAENPSALRTLRESIRERIRSGNPYSYDEIRSLAIPVSGLSRSARHSVAEDVVTFWTRCEYLSALTDPAVIYGDSGWSMEPLVGPLKRFYAGRPLDFTNETPWIFQSSSVNINLFNVQCVNSPTLRIFDVMACGGFLLTEHRPFVETLFRIGEELDTFRTPAELREKVRYYLAHPNLRIEIARTGQERVFREHRFRERFKILLSKE